jgi:restriction endonuclease Mrr
MQGIVKSVYEIICASRSMYLPYITKQQIKDTLMTVVDDDKNFDKYPYDVKYGKNKNVLDRRLEQSLYHLKKQGKIKQLKRGHWTIHDRKPVYYEEVDNGYMIKIYNHIPKIDCIVINEEIRC